MHSLPEELVGYLSQEQWDTFLLGVPVRVGHRRVVLCNGAYPYITILVAGRGFNITSGSVNKNYCWNAIYAGLQLLVKDPEYLESEITKVLQSCLTLGFQNQKPIKSPL